MENHVVDDCPDCHGTRCVREKDGSVHTCFTCLAAGRFDQHNKNVKDSGIRV